MIKYKMRFWSSLYLKDEWIWHYSGTKVEDFMWFPAAPYGYGDVAGLWTQEHDYELVDSDPGIGYAARPFCQL